MPIEELKTQGNCAGKGAIWTLEAAAEEPDTFTESAGPCNVTILANEETAKNWHLQSAQYIKDWKSVEDSLDKARDDLTQGGKPLHSIVLAGNTDRVNPASNAFRNKVIDYMDANHIPCSVVGGCDDILIPGINVHFSAPSDTCKIRVLGRDKILSRAELEGSYKQVITRPGDVFVF